MSTPSSRKAENRAGKPQLPHERDEAAGDQSTAKAGGGAAGEGQHRIGKRAADDLAEGQVDTDLHATPGLDAERREALTRPAKRRN